MVEQEVASLRFSCPRTSVPSVLGMVLWVLCGFATAAAAEQTPLSPAAGWATSYLVNAAILAEYEAVALALPEADRGRAMTSAGWQALWRRAVFADASLKAKKQVIPGEGRIKALLDAHGVLLKGVPGINELVDSLRRAAGSEPATADTAAIAGYTAVAATFGTDPMRRLWQRLTRAYDMPMPTCSVDAKDVSVFAERQKAALESGRAASTTQVLASLSGYELSKVQCLVFALMASTEDAKLKDGYDPLPLLLAMQHGGTPLGRDATIKALTAVRLMHLARYAETLSLLMDLSDLDEAFRLPYEMVQRVFSLKQKGEGAVALQGL